jgi:uncharacterized membrane protein YqgA involved in biofilm formation
VDDIIMGFVVAACSIFFGGILGGMLRQKINMKSNFALSVAIMLVSLVGLFENILGISGQRVVGEHTVVVSIALVVGCIIGDALNLEDRVYSLSRAQNIAQNGFVDSVLFFGIGGLQISGPILYALTGESFQLILKAVIDFPFALMLGATYGKKVSLSAAVVALVQLIIAAVAYALGDFISTTLLCQLCSMGYLILFFSGLNMLLPPKNKIKTVNILPGILLIILYNVILEVLAR